MFEQILEQALRIAEAAYDRVIQRWGNIPFAQSTVYDWVWSDEFSQLCCSLTELEKGRIRIHVMEVFNVRPWPWYSPLQLPIPPQEY